MLKGFYLSSISVFFSLVFVGICLPVYAQMVQDNQTVNVSGVVMNKYDGSDSPAQVAINYVTSSYDGTINPDITANIVITNEGIIPYEYRYEWCVVSDISGLCGQADDLYDATASKFISPGESLVKDVIATVSTPGHFYFKLVVYFGNNQSSASQSFVITNPSSGVVTVGGGGGGGGGSFPPAIPPAQPVLGTCVGADLNGDGKVGPTDFSIFLFYWKTKPPYKNACVDMNGDGKVNSTDFSIMLSQWGGPGIAIKKSL